MATAVCVVRIRLLNSEQQLTSYLFTQGFLFRTLLQLGLFGTRAGCSIAVHSVPFFLTALVVVACLNIKNALVQAFALFLATVVARQQRLLLAAPEDSSTSSSTQATESVGTEIHASESASIGQQGFASQLSASKGAPLEPTASVPTSATRQSDTQQSDLPNGPPPPIPPRPTWLRPPSAQVAQASEASSALPVAQSCRSASQSALDAAALPLYAVPEPAPMSNGVSNSSSRRVVLQEANSSPTTSPQRSIAARRPPTAATTPAPTVELLTDALPALRVDITSSATSVTAKPAPSASLAELPLGSAPAAAAPASVSPLVSAANAKERGPALTLPVSPAASMVEASHSANAGPSATVPRSMKGAPRKRTSAPSNTAARSEPEPADRTPVAHRSGSSLSAPARVQGLAVSPPSSPNVMETDDDDPTEAEWADMWTELLAKARRLASSQPAGYSVLTPSGLTLGKLVSLFADAWDACRRKRAARAAAAARSHRRASRERLLAVQVDARQARGSAPASPKISPSSELVAKQTRSAELSPSSQPTERRAAARVELGDPLRRVTADTATSSPRQASPSSGTDRATRQGDGDARQGTTARGGLGLDLAKAHFLLDFLAMPSSQQTPEHIAHVLAETSAILAANKECSLPSACSSREEGQDTEVQSVAPEAKHACLSQASTTPLSPPTTRSTTVDGEAEYREVDNSASRPSRRTSHGLSSGFESRRAEQDAEGTRSVAAVLTRSAPSPLPSTLGTAMELEVRQAQSTGGLLPSPYITERKAPSIVDSSQTQRFASLAAPLPGAQEASV